MNVFLYGKLQIFTKSFFFLNFFKPTRKCSAHEGLLDSHRNREAHQIVDRRPELAQILALVSANLQKSNLSTTRSREHCR